VRKKVHICFTLWILAVGFMAVDARASSLAVLVTIDPHIPAAARRTLMAEASRIWSAAGVHLDWVSAAVSRQAGTPRLHVLAIPWREGKVDGEASVLGELMHVTGSTAVAILSIDQAEAIVDRAPARPDISRDERLGLILGRAAAHEIGHFLLNMPTHADTGLMRARFSDREFADPQSTAFQLDLLQRATN
jgi:hypothetical protein